MTHTEPATCLHCGDEIFFMAIDDAGNYVSAMPDNPDGFWANRDEETMCLCGDDDCMDIHEDGHDHEPMEG